MKSDANGDWKMTSKSLIPKSGMNRREFLRYSASLGVAAATASAIWSDAAMATPKRGGHAVFATDGGSTTDTFDPAVAPGQMLILLRLAVGAALTEIARDGSVQPWLAESLEPSADAKQWVVNLRDGVTFHDGKSLTAEDVVANINYHTHPDSPSPMKSVLSGIESVAADGNSVVFTLSAGNADFPALLSNYSLTIHPSADGEISFTPIVGLGPFMMESFRPGESAKLVRNPNYFIPERPYFDSVELININDAQTRLQSLMSREVMGISALDPQAASRLDGVEGMSVLAQTSGGFFTYDCNITNSPLDDNNVRMALKHGLNREQFVQTVLNGYGSVGNDNPIGPAYQYHNASIAQRVYDPEKAKYHLEQSGLSSVSVDLHTAEDTFAGAMDGALLFAESAKAAGIEINVRREPSDGYWTEVWGQKPIFASYWSQYASPDLLLSLAYLGGSGWNATGFANARHDELVVAARAELDQAKRAEMYGEIQQILHDEGPSFIPAHRPVMTGLSDKIGHNEGETTTRDFSDGRGFERWWLA